MNTVMENKRSIFFLQPIDSQLIELKLNLEEIPEDQRTVDIYEVQSIEESMQYVSGIYPALWITSDAKNCLIFLSKNRSALKKVNSKVALYHLKKLPPKALKKLNQWGPVSLIAGPIASKALMYKIQLIINALTDPIFEDENKVDVIKSKDGFNELMDSLESQEPQEIQEEKKQNAHSLTESEEPEFLKNLHLNFDNVQNQEENSSTNENLNLFPENDIDNFTFTEKKSSLFLEDDVDHLHQNNLNLFDEEKSKKKKTINLNLEESEKEKHNDLNLFDNENGKKKSSGLNLFNEEEKNGKKSIDLNLEEKEKEKSENLNLFDKENQDFIQSTKDLFLEEEKTQSKSSGLNLFNNEENKNKKNIDLKLEESEAKKSSNLNLIDDINKDKKNIDLKLADSVKKDKTLENLDLANDLFIEKERKNEEKKKDKNIDLQMKKSADEKSNTLNLFEVENNTKFIDKIDKKNNDKKNNKDKSTNSLSLFDEIDEPEEKKNNKKIEKQVELKSNRKKDSSLNLFEEEDKEEKEKEKKEKDPSENNKKVKQKGSGSLKLFDDEKVSYMDKLRNQAKEAKEAKEANMEKAENDQIKLDSENAFAPTEEKIKNQELETAKKIEENLNKVYANKSNGIEFIINNLSLLKDIENSKREMEMIVKEFIQNVGDQLNEICPSKILFLLKDAKNEKYQVLHDMLDENDFNLEDFTPKALTIRVPKFKDHTLQSYDQEFFYPFYEGEINLGICYLKISHQVSLDQSKFLEMILETCKGAYLTLYHIKVKKKNYLSIASNLEEFSVMAKLIEVKSKITGFFKKIFS